MQEGQHLSLLGLEQRTQTRARCLCPPLSPLYNRGSLAGEMTQQEEAFLPVAASLNHALQIALARHFPRSTPLSLLLLHITQLEHIQIPPTSSTIYKRLNCHASASLLEQIIQSIRRTLRVTDEILSEESGAGAVILLPEVDYEGMARIAPRISQRINLLQAETIVPPLQYETEIVLGSATFPWPANALDMLLYHAGSVQEKITFRPAVLSQFTADEKLARRKRQHTQRLRVKREDARLDQGSGIPFMHIPTRLPTRLRQLIPHALALELHCAPVGRDQRRLTVAMAKPDDLSALAHLREITGMTIFPVSCDISALDSLLASGW